MIVAPCPNDYSGLYMTEDATNSEIAIGAQT